MPRCCSRRIQSEVSWRAALRPLTVPAIAMAPPNSNSFSVSVVLPASGCEMMAKVRRRAICCSSVVMTNGWQWEGKRRAILIDAALEHERIFAAVDGLIVAAPHADLHKPQGLIEPDRGSVGGACLEERLLGAGAASGQQQVRQQAPADTAAPVGIGDAKIE